MHRIDTKTAQKDKFGAGKNGFTRGNPQTGTPATDLDDDYFDMLQEELCSVVEASGASLEKARHDQLLTALRALLLSRKNPFGDIKSDGTVKTALENLGLGEAAKSRVLQSGGDSVKDVMSQNAITYQLSLKAGVNGERVEAENFREALNLGNAALKNTGTGQGQLPDMSAFLSNQEVNGYQYLPGGLILQWGNTPCGDRRTTVSKFPIPFPNECLMVIVCGFQVAGTYQAYTVVNGEWNDQFSWNAFYAQSGNIPVLAAAGQVNARFLAIGR